jgi:hydrogenase nickel incorporation protein HypA/HybF
MTERELAKRVLAAFDRAAYTNAVHHVSRVRIAVGGRRHFDFELLDRTFADAARGTVADGARLLVKLLSVIRHCQRCGATVEGSAQDLGCRACGNAHTEAVNGEEVKLLDIELDIEVGEN